MKHRAKVYEEKRLKGYKDFEFLCDAVLYCNTNSSKSDRGEVVEVHRSLTGYEEYGTITSWDYKAEYV